MVKGRIARISAREVTWAVIATGVWSAREASAPDRGAMSWSAEAQGAVPGAAGLVGGCSKGWPGLVSGARGRVWCRADEAGRPGSRAVRVSGRTWARALRWPGLTRAWLKL